jgi:ureidoacrylate peracid hydrolase
MSNIKSSLLPENIERITGRDGAPHSITEFDPKATALLIIDMQNFYMLTGQMAYCAGAEAIVPVINTLAETMRRAGSKIIWLRNITNSGVLKSWPIHYERMKPERVETRKRELAKGGEGFRFWHKMDVRDGDLKINKSRYSAFIPGASNIEKTLGENGIETLVICGIVTNVCVDSTARDAMMLNYRVLVIDDACTAATPEIHAHSLNTFYLNFGDVQTSDELLSNLGAAAR